MPQLRRVRLFRMALEAVEQGPRLTQEDFVRLLGVDLRTVRRIVNGYRQAGVYIPTCSYSQDMGWGTSHKAIAVRMFLQYATYSQIEQKTGDMAASLIRCLKDFSAVVRAQELGVPEHQIPALCGFSERPVGEYLALYRRVRLLGCHSHRRIHHPGPDEPDPPGQPAVRTLAAWADGLAGRTGRFAARVSRQAPGRFAFTADCAFDPDRRGRR